MIINDYKNYIKDNENLINNIKNFNIYGRLSDALNVMNFICAMKDTQGTIDQDLVIIFETGFDYIQDTLETIKIYLHNYFNDNYKELKKYDYVINYLLYLDDITDVLKEKKLYDENKLKFIGETLDKVLREKLEFNIDDANIFDVAINECIGNEQNVFTTYEIFSMIAEELGI